MLRIYQDTGVKEGGWKSQFLCSKNLIYLINHTILFVYTVYTYEYMSPS
jgi:hypothetical protein